MKDQTKICLTASLGMIVVMLSMNVAGSCVSSPAGLVGWWTGDGNANDLAGNNNGTLQGGATANAAGQVGSAFHFDGINSYVRIPDSQSFHLSTLTVECWVRFDAYQTPGTTAYPYQQYMVFKQNSLNYNFEGFALTKDHDPQGNVFLWEVSSARGGLTRIDSVSTVVTGVWYHVAGVRGPNYIQLYKDGVLEAQTNVNFPQDYGNLPLYFGTSGQSFYDRKLAGSLDEISLYNRALSGAEIAAIYAAGAAGKCKGGDAPPAILAQPQSQSVVVGSNAAFTVIATGTAPLSYQWQRNGLALVNGGRISGATTATLNLANAQPADSAGYRAIVANALGGVTSVVATLTVTPAPIAPNITGQPVSQTIAAGSSVAFSVTATGTAPLGYQWQGNGTNLPNGGRISGATSPTVTLANIQSTDAGNYRVMVSNGGGSATSTVAALTVLVSPAIAVPPGNKSVVAGNDVSFSVIASGTAPLNYRWLFNDASLADGGQFSGVTTPTLFIHSAQTANEGGYSVVVTNMVGSVTSPIATLTLTVPGDCAAPPAGLISWWPGDGNANDITGTNNGILQGGATANAIGVVGQALSFNGTSSFVRIADSPLLRPANFTIEAWVLFSSLNSAGNSSAGQQYIIFKQNTRSYVFEGFYLGKERTATGDRFAFDVSAASGQWAEVVSTPLIVTSVWYHVACVRGPNYIQLYTNGQFAAQTTVAFPQNYGNFPLYFGTSGQSFWDHKFAGLLDEVSLYNRALSATEIAAIYAAGSDGKCKGPNATPSSLQISSELAQAAAPEMTCRVRANGELELTVSGQLQQHYAIEASEDLVHWSEVTTLRLENGAVQFSEPMSGRRRLFRVKLLP